MRTIENIKIKKGTRILMRVDCNVPLKNRFVDAQSAWRLEQTLSDIKLLRKRGAVVLIMGHIGDPEGEKKLSLSTRPVAHWYEKKLKTKVLFLHDVENFEATKRLKSGSVVMLENLRFWKGEQNNSAKFARMLSRLGDIYVNNAFGVSHRKHASVHAITKCMKSYAGSLLVREQQYLSEKKEKPFALVIGGLKLETKAPLIMRLGKESDFIFVGGGIAIAIASAQHQKNLLIADSVVSRKERILARQILRKYPRKLFVPIDYMCIRNNKKISVCAMDIKAGDKLIDIGPSTIDLYKKTISSARSIIWNGTMGQVEVSGGQSGTMELGKSIDKRQNSIVGGGDTVGFLQKNNLLEKFDFVSTGGGAMLAFLSGEKLPGINVLKYL